MLQPASAKIGQFVVDTFPIRLTESIKHHFGVLVLYKWFTTKACFGHEAGPETKAAWAYIRCTRLHIVLRIVFVSTGTLVSPAPARGCAHKRCQERCSDSNVHAPGSGNIQADMSETNALKYSSQMSFPFENVP